MDSIGQQNYKFKLQHIKLISENLS